jgi:hypothetical protein
MIKKLINNTASAVPLPEIGQEVPASGDLTVDPSDYANLSKSSTAITNLADGTLTFNNGSFDVTNLATATQIIQGGFSQVHIDGKSPWDDKQIGDKKLFTRIQGEKMTLAVGSNSNTYVITYALCKIDGIEIIGGCEGDTISFQILDDQYGTVSTIPNYVLNQFGFDVNVAEKFYRWLSKYDADLFVGLQIKIIYEATTAKDIGVNYSLHELV